MTPKELQSRWKNSDFVEGQKTVLQALSSADSLTGLDLRGIVIGREHPLKLYKVHFVRRTVRDVDFSAGEFGSSLAESVLESSTFDQAKFLTCSLGRARISDCTFNDALFESCDLTSMAVQNSRFVGAVFRERPSMGVQLMRSRFTGCDFSNAVFRGAELRAAKFFDCKFEGARFEKCDLRATKFEGGAPAESQLVRCTV
ncbi:MAG TPA: pentapeptide repeat-containing protein [Thermoanaerobaculia bacterium]|nr:pentapeptide repeat-containing protein [Thermoanaerobaculia bacterium]